jgi:serine protease
LIGAPTIAAGDGVEIAIIDTGNLPQHPDYSQANEGCNGGFDFISSPFQAMDGDGWDSNPTDLGDLYLSYHGSHVSGTIGANTQNSLGVAGIAWGASLCHLRVLGLTGGTEYDLIQAILYASALPGDYEAYVTRRSQPVDIINLSLGGGSYSSVENNTIQAAIANGVILVAAMGNDGSSALSYPAAYSGVIGVGATDSRRKIASYSNSGAHIDVSAPGGELYCPEADSSCFSGQALDQQGDGYPDGILSLSATGYGASISYGYIFYEGTSMATPHISAVIALMKQQHPALNTPLFTALLQQGLLTQDLLTAGFDTKSGYGEIDTLKAVLAAQNLSSAPPSQQMLLSNAAPIFTESGTTSIDITNLSASTVQVTSIQKVESWVTVTPHQSLPITLLPNQSFSMSVDASLDELSVGDTIATVSIHFDDATQRSFPVIASLPPLPLTSIGDVYVVLLDQSGAWPAYISNQWQYAIQRLQPNNQGYYQFSFNSAGSGDDLDNFLLYASTDLDGDGELCDFGGVLRQSRLFKHTEFSD